MRAGAIYHAAKSTFPEHLRLDGLKIVIDCAHGAAYQVAPAALWELGAEVISLGISPNGIQHQRPVRIDPPGGVAGEGRRGRRGHRHCA
jgi:phosphomannomutase